MPPAGVALERFHRANAYHPRAGWLDSGRIGVLWLRTLLETTTTRPGRQSGGGIEFRRQLALFRFYVVALVLCGEGRNGGKRNS